MPRYAAVDIGSNSVRMLIADVGPNRKIQILAEERQVTRLGASVFEEGRISKEAAEFVCTELSQMAMTILKHEVVAVRAVATSAVRDANNQAEFLAAAQAALGHPVEIISGQEEARLIHLGVESRWPQTDKRILMIDVGGGSSEVILSESGTLVEAFSKPLGAVRLTEVFLRHDPPLPRELQRMNEFIEEKLAEPVSRIGGKVFDRAIGTSATAAAIVSAANRIPRARRDEADRAKASLAQVRRLYNELSEGDVALRRKMVGIGPRRAELIIAGTAVFLQMLEQFQLGALYYSAAGVRDGIIADLAARGVGSELSQLNADQRRVVEEMATRYEVKIEHARKVASLARELFVSLSPVHKLAPQYGRLLEASAYLHDIGHFVSDTSHHKHSYYLVANSDMPGFTDAERQFIATLCRYHRRSAPAIRHPQFQAVDPNERQALILLTPLLRLADSLDRGHAQRVEHIAVELRDGNVVLKLESMVDADLEIWAAERIADLFRETYGVGLVLSSTASQTVRS